jgi:hypothetical protein
MDIGRLELAGCAKGRAKACAIESLIAGSDDECGVLRVWLGLVLQQGEREGTTLDLRLRYAYSCVMVWLWIAQSKSTATFPQLPSFMVLYASPTWSRV